MKNLLICVLLCLIPGCNGSQAVQEVHEMELDNGLKVVLLPLPTATTNTLVVLYDVGNRFDPPGKSGMAHLSEHLYVTAATENTKARNVQEYVAAYPDGWNAQTGDDYTVIATVFKAHRTDDELADAAERMRKIKVDQADLDRELPRIDVELRNMYGGFPMLAVANHGRHHASPLPNDGRRGGKIEELNTVTVAEIQNWLDQYYKPGNATLVLAGAFDEQSIRQAITEQFGGIPKGDEPNAPKTASQEIDTTVHTIELQQVSAKLRVGFTFQAPKPDNPLFGAFLVLATRMQMNAMKQSKNPQDIPFMFRPLDDPGFFYASVDVAEDESADAALVRLEKMITDELGAELKKHQVTSTKAQMAMFFGTREVPHQMKAMNPYGSAFSLARRLQTGVDSEKLIEQLDGLDNEQMQQAAESFFSAKNRATIIANPKK